MLMYFIVFTIIGFGIGVIVKDIEKAIPIIMIISGVWGLIYAPVWGLATFGELSLGYYIYMMNAKKSGSGID